MSEYRVIKFFTDLQDNKHPYNVGDIFPRDGVTVDEARLTELSSSKNRQGKPLIKKIDEPKPIITDDVTEAVIDEPIEVAETVEAETTETVPAKSKKKGRKKNVDAE